MGSPLLSVRISVDYPGRPNVITEAAFDLAEGEACGLAGPSGAGKSTIALAIFRLLELRGGRVRGSIRFAGRELIGMKERELRRLRGREMALILQSPASSLNPALRLESQLREAWRAHSTVPWREALPRVQALLERIGLPAGSDFLHRYPSQVSVGQAQRILIAMAALHHPKLIVADEPISALDQDSRRETLNLLRMLKDEDGAALLYISHDLASMAELCDRMFVLREGRVAPAPQVEACATA
jgi:ABC-type glutathione transport system ATPase component